MRIIGINTVTSLTLYSGGMMDVVVMTIPTRARSEINICFQKPLKIFGSCLKKFDFSTDFEVVVQLMSMPRGWAMRAAAMGIERPEKKMVKKSAAG
jgi:hypothetical protein